MKSLYAFSIMMLDLIYVHFMSFYSAIDSRGAGFVRAPPEIGSSEKRTEREIDNL